MNKKSIINYFVAFTRIYLALVFLISGLDKASDLASFAQSIENYKLIPVEYVNLIAIIIPWIELISGGLLLLGIFIKENSTIILTMLIVFTSAILSAYLRGLNIDCGCQGTFESQKVGLLKIVENISLMIVSFLSIRFPNQVLTFIKQN